MICTNECIDFNDKNNKQIKIDDRKRRKRGSMYLIHIDFNDKNKKRIKIDDGRRKKRMTWRGGVD